MTIKKEKDFEGASKNNEIMSKIICQLCLGLMLLIET